MSGMPKCPKSGVPRCLRLDHLNETFFAEPIRMYRADRYARIGYTGPVQSVVSSQEPFGIFRKVTIIAKGNYWFSTETFGKPPRRR